MDEDLVSRITVIQRKGEHSDAVTVYRSAAQTPKDFGAGAAFRKGGT